MRCAVFAAGRSASAGRWAGVLAPSSARQAKAAMIREGVMTSIFAVIRVVRKDRSGAVKLFGQHGARQQMRPCRRAERQQQVGLRATAFLMPVRRTDVDTRPGPTLVPPPLQLLLLFHLVHVYPLLM